MSKSARILVGFVTGAVLTVVVSVAAQQPAAGPTAKDPLRFRAVLQTQGQDAGLQGVADIVVERWSTDAERKSLVDLLAGTTLKTGGQDKLLRALQNTKPRNGYIRLPNSIGWDLHYARDFVQADGSRQIVIATDKPVSFAAAATGAESTDYPFTLIEMRMGKDNKGGGCFLVQAAATTENGRLELENYGNEPIKLSMITEEVKKDKK